MLLAIQEWNVRENVEVIGMSPGTVFSNLIVYFGIKVLYSGWCLLTIDHKRVFGAVQP